MTQTLGSPVFPLNTVLFPGCLMPLRIFEQRYLRMVRECTAEDKPFVVSLIRGGKEVGEKSPAHNIGTLAKIVDFSQGQGGVLDILCKASSRVRISDTFYEEDKLMRGKIERYTESEMADLPERFEDFSKILTSMKERYGNIFEGEANQLSASEVSFCLSYLAPVSLPAKQRLLVLQDTEKRLHELQKIYGGQSFTFTA